jgi:broad specificity phosphatase PhoE
MKKEYRELRRRPLLTPLWLSAFLGLAMVGAVVWFLSHMTTTTVVFVRHAEKELGTIDDPPLSTEGEQRAQLLARLFGDPAGPGRIQAVYSSNTRRSVGTATPLATRLGLSVTIASETRQILDGIRQDYRGGNILVVGHSNTVAQMVRQFSGREDVPDLGESDYAAIYLVTAPTLGRASVLRMSY